MNPVYEIKEGSNKSSRNLIWSKGGRVKGGSGGGGGNY